MLTYLEMLQISFQADGSFSGRREKYTGVKNNTVAIRYSLKKDRKKRRLKNILSNLPFKYSWSEYENGYCSVRIKIPLDIFKSFSKNLSDMFNLEDKSKGWAKSFINEIGHWDGDFKKDRPNNIGYCSNVEENTKFVVSVAILAGYSATFTKYVDKREDCVRKPTYNTNINLLNKPKKEN